MGHAERRQKSLGALYVRPILVDHDRGRARLDASVDQLLEISDRPGVARFHPGDGVVRLGLVGIDRGGKANPVVGSVADGVLVKLSEVAEDLDELKPIVLAVTRSFWKSRLSCGPPPMN
jgi:hypothetical protein